VRLPRRRRHSLDDEADPIAAFRIHYEHLAVEVEKHVETLISAVRHILLLSH